MQVRTLNVPYLQSKVGQAGGTYLKCKAVMNCRQQNYQAQQSEETSAAYQPTCRHLQAIY